MKSKVNYDNDAVKNTFNRFSMRRVRTLHKLAHYIHNIRELRSRNPDVLKSTNNTPVQRWRFKLTATKGNEVRTRRHRRGKSLN